MNFKKFIFKNRYLIIVFSVFIVPIVIFASVDYQKYDIYANTIGNIIWPRQAGSTGSSNDYTAPVASASAFCVNNNSANKYFIGNRTQSEILSFFNNMPPGISYNTSNCVDGVCNGTECDNY